MPHRIFRVETDGAWLLMELFAKWKRTIRLGEEPGGAGKRTI